MPISQSVSVSSIETISFNYPNYIVCVTKAIKTEVVTEIWDFPFLDTSIVCKKFDFRNKTFLYQKIPKKGRVKHCFPYLI